MSKRRKQIRLTPGPDPKPRANAAMIREAQRFDSALNNEDVLKAQHLEERRLERPAIKPEPPSVVNWDVIAELQWQEQIKHAKSPSSPSPSAKLTDNNLRFRAPTPVPPAKLVKPVRPVQAYPTIQRLDGITIEAAIKMLQKHWAKLTLAQQHAVIRTIENFAKQPKGN
jgi:hypothetical protein